MSVANPPIIVTSIYNPAFFEASADTITQAQANALFLKKTTADTATALETFSGGIITNALNATSGTLVLGAINTTELACGSSRGSATVSIGTAGSGNVNLAGNVAQTIRKFGGSQGTDYQYDNTNLIVGTQNMALYNTQTSGKLDIGTGARLLSGQGGGINIGTGSGATANPITIGGASSALTLNGGIISIGNGFSTTNLNGTSIISNLGINSVDRVNAGTLSIGTTNATLVNISKTGIDTAVLGTLSIADSGGVKTVNVDTIPSAGTLTIGTVNASLVNISKTGTNTAVLGTLSVGDSGGVTTVKVDTSSATTLSIGTANANPVNICRTGTNTFIKGTLSVAEGISLPTPINLTYTTIPTYSSSQIGYRFQDHPANFTMTGTALQNMYTFTSLPIGVYILQVQAYCNTTNYNVNISYSATSASQDNTQTITVQGALDAQFNFLNVWTQGTASNIYIVVSANKSIPFQLIYMTYTRIA